MGGIWVKKSIGAKEQFGGTPLHIAVQYNSVRVVELLLEKHASCNVKDQFRRVPLQYASEQKVKTLLLEKCDKKTSR